MLRGENQIVKSKVNLNYNLKIHLLSQNAQYICFTKTRSLLLLKEIYIVRCKKNNKSHK